MKDAAAELYERLVILRCQAGDELALGELIERFSPGVRLYLAKMGGRAAVDDLLQDTWFDVYRKIDLQALTEQVLRRIGDGYGSWGLGA